MGTSGNRDCQSASRSVSKNFTEDVLTISAGNLFQNVTARILRRISDGGYNISVGGTCRRGRVALCGLDMQRWTPWGILGDHG